MLIMIIFQSTWLQLDISSCSCQSYSVIRSIDSTLLGSTLFYSHRLFLFGINLSTLFLPAFQHQFGNFSPFWKQRQKLSNEGYLNENTMANWTNIYWNNRLCKKSGAIYLVQLGPMAGWLAGRWNIDKIWTKKFNIGCFSLRLTKLQGYYAVWMHLSWYFQLRTLIRWLFEVWKSRSHSFPCQSLLLGTTILYEIYSLWQIFEWWTWTN